MFNVCPACGTYSVDKAIDPNGPFAICPACGHRQPFVALPLFVITGASGAGKTSIALELPARLPECVVLESDILWRAAFDTPESDYRDFRETWLRLAKNINQSGRPVVLLGTAVPEQFEACSERHYFSALHILALVCDERLLAARLKRRPAWRRAGTDEFVERMVRFNRWLRDNAGQTRPPMTLLDTSKLTVADAADRTAAWVRERIAPAADQP